MKKNKNFFSKNLYLEGLRQLKVVGILGMIITLILAVIIPIGNYLSAKSNYRSYVNNNIAGQFTKYAINAVDYHIYYLLFILVFGPLMVIVLFRFLNRREDCDFYHALPHTRHCLFLSFFASVITWLAAQIFLATVVSAVLYQIFSSYLVLEVPRLLCFAVNILAASLLVAAALLLACSLSGNTITGLIVFLILFFTPRIFMTIYQSLMSSELDYLADSIHSIFYIQNNLFYNILQSLNSDSAKYILTTLGFPTICTLCMAVILSALAFVFFAKRKSEAAENSMNNKILQAVFRTIFTMLLCMIPISILFSYYAERNILFSQYRYNDESVMVVFYTVISYIIVILGMFLYELLTTKNAKSALRSLKSIPLIAVLNAVIFFLLICSFGHYRNLRLDEKEIDAVNIVSMGQFYGYDYQPSSYFKAMVSKYDFTDKELISLLCTAFNDYADIYNDYLDGKREHTNINDSSADSYSLAVEFHGKSDYTFHLKLSPKMEEQFYTLLYSNKEFYDIYMKLPELTDRDSIYFSSAGYSTLDTELAKKLYECLKTELAEGDISPEKWIKGSNFQSVGQIIVNKYIDSVYYDLELPININTPKTYQLLMEYYAETHENNLEAFLDFLEDFENILTNPAHDENNDNAYIDITGYTSKNEAMFLYLNTMEESLKEYQAVNSRLKQCISLLRGHTKSISDMSEQDMIIYVRVENVHYNESYSDDDFYILCIPQDIFAELQNIEEKKESLEEVY